jgi:hypothetical protein
MALSAASDLSRVDFMIRYSSYASTNYRTPSERTHLDPLAAEYRELQELRERVKRAEAAAAQRLNGGSKSPARTESYRANIVMIEQRADGTWTVTADDTALASAKVTTLQKLAKIAF